MRDRIEAAIKDACYSARDNGGTMHTAATDATEAVLTVLAEPDEATVIHLARALWQDTSNPTPTPVPDDYCDAARYALGALRALAGTSAQARHTAADTTGGGEDG